MLISSNKVDDLSIIPNIYNITHGYDDRFEINKKDIDPIILESISINMKKKELLRFLTSDIVSINKKLDLVTKYEILIPSNISQMNFFSGGLMNDFNFNF
jgi:hypothetical protein